MKISQKIVLPVLALVVGMGSYFATNSFIIGQSHGGVASADAMGTQVLLRADRAVPDTVTIQAGDTVQFNSGDGKKHDMAMGKGGADHEHTGAFHSGEFGADEAWRVQFKQAGTYYMHDHENPDINVLIVVYTPSTP